MRTKECEKFEAALAAFMRTSRDLMDDIVAAVQRARSLARDALDDAKEAIAPALGRGPLYELDAAANALDDILADAEDAVEAARDGLYGDE
jgi:hypothetical protein